MKKVQIVLGALLLVAGATSVAMATPPVSAPEIGPDSAASALALVSGMMLVIRGRRRK
jgi:hypothetical protein